MCYPQALEKEIESREPLVDAVAQQAYHMIEKKHYAAKVIQERLDDLQNQRQELKDIAAARKDKLKDALESQKVRGSVRRHKDENLA